MQLTFWSPTWEDANKSSYNFGKYKGTPISDVHKKNGVKQRLVHWKPTWEPVGAQILD